MIANVNYHVLPGGIVTPPDPGEWNPNLSILEQMFTHAYWMREARKLNLNTYNENDPDRTTLSSVPAAEGDPVAGFPDKIGKTFGAYDLFYIGNKHLSVHGVNTIGQIDGLPPIKVGDGVLCTNVPNGGYQTRDWRYEGNGKINQSGWGHSIMIIFKYMYGQDDESLIGSGENGQYIGFRNGHYRVGGADEDMFDTPNPTFWKTSSVYIEFTLDTTKVWKDRETDFTSIPNTINDNGLPHADYKKTKNMILTTTNAAPVVIKGQYIAMGNDAALVAANRAAVRQDINDRFGVGQMETMPYWSGVVPTWNEAQQRWEAISNETPKNATQAQINAMTFKWFIKTEDGTGGFDKLVLVSKNRYLYPADYASYVAIAPLRLVRVYTQMEGGHEVMSSNNFVS